MERAGAGRRRKAWKNYEGEMTCKYTRHKATSGAAAAAAESTERERERAGGERWKAQEPLPSAAAGGGEQSRTEQRWAIDRKSEDGYTRLWQERERGRARSTTFLTFLHLVGLTIEGGHGQERVRCEKCPPSLQARTDALNNEFNYKWRSVPASPPSCSPLARPAAALHREPDWQRPPPPPPNDL